MNFNLSLTPFIYVVFFYLALALSLFSIGCGVKSAPVAPPQTELPSYIMPHVQHKTLPPSTSEVP